MSFDTLPFLVFATAVYLLWRTRLAPVTMLAAASVLFYLAAGLNDALLIAAVVVVNYFFGFVVRGRLSALAAIVALDLLNLAYFKYRAFLLGGVAGLDWFTGQVLIPLGISFYTFQLIAYQADVAAGRCEHEPSFPRFGLFVIFFPQLIAGPIVRAETMLPQIRRLWDGHRRRPIIHSVGLGLCALGVFKKVFLSDSLAPIVDEVFTRGPADALSAWMGAWLFAFQIYFDFSGYCDIALGAAYLLGFRLPLNFRQPYVSLSPREFWQRWHMTLSSWIRDYLYIPLGGNRGGMARATAVLVLVMALAGLWHGASFVFVIWGALWGVYIAVWRVAGRYLPGSALVRWPLNMAVVVILWVFFRSPDAGFAFDYVAVMFGAGGGGGAALAGAGEIWAWVGCALLMMLHVGEAKMYSVRFLRLMRRADNVLVLGLLYGAIAAMLILPKTSQNPFIYFRF